MKYRIKWIDIALWVRKDDKHVAFSRDVSNVINFLRGELLREKKAPALNPNNK